MSEMIDSTDKQPVQPGLYLVSTPIGNLRDMTLRAIDVLQACDAVICEDTRVTGKLLNAYNARKPMLVYNDHSDDIDREKILERLAAGQALALVTDAGTPLISDPGYKLVHACMGRGIAIVPIPGASAILPALQLAALPCERFLFSGFLPHKSSARRALFEKLKTVPVTMVFYESPNRIAESVADAYAALGDRPAAIVREITKIYEEARHGTLAAWAADETLLPALKGEFVFVIGGAAMDAATPQEIEAALRDALQTLSVKDAAAAISDAMGASKKTVYDMALQIKNGKSSNT